MKHFFLFFLTFLPFIAQAQTIKGTVKGVGGESIPLANILIKPLDSPTQISEFARVRAGKYTYTLKKDYAKGLILEARVLGYISKRDTLITLQKDKTYTIDFVLSPDIKDLKEIVVEAKKLPFKEKKDTVVYDVEAYSDGTERKIQEVIKKLPGMEVNEKSGEIKYRGKSVETVMLDGDNLFDYNYAIGTKNINVSMVEQIEAIDNYSENPLLKGIEQGGKVALNLKLKKGKVDFSGGVSLGSGLFEDGKQVWNSDNTLLGITKNYKSFANLTYNNIGINHSPFDYFGFNTSVEQLKEQNFYAQKAIPEALFSSDLDEIRANINNAWFGSYNAMFKIKKRLSIKTNLYYLRDEIFSRQTFESQNEIDGRQFTTSDERTTDKLPRQYRGDLELKYHTSKTSLLEYDLRLRQENIRTPYSVLVNNANSFQSELRSEDFYLKQKLLWTKKLSNRKALQVTLHHANNDIPQTFSINPSTLGVSDAEQDIQNATIKKQYLEGKLTLLGASQAGRYTFSLGGVLDENPFTSRLFSVASNNQEQEQFSNDLTYRKNSLYSFGSYNFSLGRWRISPAYNLSVLYQEIDNQLDKERQTQTNLIFEPSLSLTYKINNISSIQTRLSYRQNPNAANYSFTHPLLINNRLLTSNTPSLDLQRGVNSSIFYRLNDLYEQFSLNFGISYRQTTGNIFSNFNIEERTTRLNYFFLDENTDNLSFSFNTSKLIDILSTSFSLSSSYAISRYKNIVNDSDLRDNQRNNYSVSLSVRTAFDFPINFNNEFGFEESKSQNEESGTFINASLYNNSELMLRLSDSWIVSFTGAYFLPNTAQKSQDFFFLDALITFTPEKAKYEINFAVNNILNIDNFQQVSTTDYSIDIFQSNLIPRYFLLNFNLEF